MKTSSRKSPNLQNDTQELVANITKLMADAEDMLNESTSHHAEEKVALLRGRYGRGENRAMDRYLSAKGKISRFTKRADATIRACPYEALVIALGVGALLGGVLARRDE